MTMLPSCSQDIFVRGFATFARLGPQTTITLMLLEELRKLARLEAI